METNGGEGQGKDEDVIPGAKSNPRVHARGVSERVRGGGGGGGTKRERETDKQTGRQSFSFSFSFFSRWHRRAR